MLCTSDFILYIVVLQYRWQVLSKKNTVAQCKAMTNRASEQKQQQQQQKTKQIVATNSYRE